MIHLKKDKFFCSVSLQLDPISSNESLQKQNMVLPPGRREGDMPLCMNKRTKTKSAECAVDENIVESRDLTR